MKKAIIVLFTAFLIHIQAQTTIVNDSVINTYAEVTAIDFCKNALSLANNAENNFSIGEKVLIIQMKGAELNSEYNSNNGNVVNYLAAGSYEYNYVKSINFGSINGLQFEYTLSHPYFIAGKIQVIKIPQYTDVEFQSTLSCLPWNGSTGGILAFEASGNVSLQANIFLNELGFRGAEVSNDNTCFTQVGGFQGYSCQDTLDCGAFKAEGSGLHYDNNLKGRGRNGSGGGGGNDHNAGGGGGGNAGLGGNGGDNDLNTQFCDGSGGLGGENNVFDNNLNNRILMGGAGGAGDSNNNSGTSGGNAGAAVLIKAASLTSNGFKITSNGQNADFSIADGAGGGGAGGTIILDIDNYTDVVNIEAKGGKGGDITDPDNCPGVGGGASGGTVWIKQAVVPTNINFDVVGGAMGVYTSAMCSGLSLGSEDGEDGKIFNNYKAVINDVPFIQTRLTVGADTLICAGDETRIFANISSSANPSFEWLFESASFSSEKDLLVAPTERGLNRYHALVSWEVFDQACVEEKYVNITLRNPEIVIVVDPTTPVEVGDPVFLNAVINPTNPNYTYQWTQNYVVPNNDRNAVVEPFESTKFCITITDEILCQKIACVDVPVSVPISGYPDAFTPNNDGVNDVYRILPEPQLRQTSFKIYNRWGDLIYQSESVFEWDGTYKGKQQAADVYTWIADFEHKNTGESLTQTGSFTLIR